MNKITTRQLATSTLLWLAACLVVGLVSKAAYAQGTPNKLESIDVQNLAGQQLQITLRHSAPPAEPVAFTIDNPARISLDLADTALALPSRRIDVRAGGVDSILAAEASGRTRLVLNLDRLIPYQTRVVGNDVIMTLGASASNTVAAGAASAGSSAPRSAAVAAPSGPRAIKSIDFRRGTGGTGRVIVRLSDPRTPVSLRQLGNQVVVDFTGAEVASNLARRYDAGDFATPVTGFDVVRVADGVRIAISAVGDFEQLAYQTDDQYVVEVQPARKAQQKTEEKRVYSGERLTLNFQDIETRAVLQLLADASGQNIVVSDSVQGSVTLRLQNVPWDQALDIVLRTKGLDKRRNDNVIIVAPTEELAAREKAELAARQDVQELAPLRTEYLQVNYAKAADLAALIKTQSGTATSGLLSKRGSVSVDERTNTLLLQDSSDRLEDIRRLVGTLDIPIRQVQIEARIVIVNDDFSRELGARAGFSGFDFFSNNLGYTSGSALNNDDMLELMQENFEDDDPSNDGRPVFVLGKDDSIPQRYNVNLPVASPAGSLAYMLLGRDFLIDLELSAAQAEGRGEVISTPRVITANQREASIEQGVEIGYQESASSGATTIQFKKAVLSLRVTPQVTPDNRIILDLNVKKDSVGQIFVGIGGQQVPSIDTREITTQVLVNDGQTVVLGGILETERRETEKKVPYLGDIPVLGRIFKTTGRSNNKDELLIFVTPKILREGVSVY